MKLPDVQNESKSFLPLFIEKVGVRGIKVPFKLLKKDGDSFSTIATISSYTNMDDTVKGISMSRISRTINKILSENELGFLNLNKFVSELKDAHRSQNTYIKAKFDYIIIQSTPISNIISQEPIEVIFESVLKNDEIKNYLTIKMVSMSLCPCSKEMSLLRNNLTVQELNALEDAEADMPRSLINKIKEAGFGAHNQKSIIEVKVELNKLSRDLMWIEDLVKIINESSSSEIWSTLKREDEKYVTEVSYMGKYIDQNGQFVEVGGGPKFVEDISREIASKLNNEIDNRILDYVIVVNNQESIHSGEIVATSILSAGRILK